MKCFLPDFPADGAFGLMRWFGYTKHREKDGSLSFVRSSFATEARFPRFHASVCSHDGGLQVNIHLDQENSEGHDNHQFVWTYHNQLVSEEAQRLLSLLDKSKQELITPTAFPSLDKPLTRIIKPPGKIISFLSKRKILCRFF